MSVIDLADLVKALETEFGVSAAMPVSSGAVASAEAAPAQEEKNAFKVALVNGGPEKLKTIKALRQVTPLGLAEAKTAVEAVLEGTAAVIAEAASKDDAKKIKEALEAAGAQVKLS